MARYRNPVAAIAQSKALPFALIAAGVYFVYKSKQAATAAAAPVVDTTAAVPVSGFGAYVSSPAYQGVGGLAGLLNGIGLGGVFGIDRSGALPGMGHLGFSLSKAIKSVATSAIPIVGPSMAIKQAANNLPGNSATITKIAQNIATATNPLIGPVQLTKQVISSKGASLMPAQRPQSVPADTTTGQATVYEDANGNVITEDQYNQLMAQYQQQLAAQQAAAAAPPPLAPSSTIQAPGTAAGQYGYVYDPYSGQSIPLQPSGYTYGMNGAILAYNGVPTQQPAAAAASQQYATPSSAGQSFTDASLYDPNAGYMPQASAPAPLAPDQSAAAGGTAPAPDPTAAAPASKVNPFMVVGAVAAVPVFMSFLGGK